jgi:hypothetical protein
MTALRQRISQRGFRNLGGDHLDVHLSELIPAGDQWNPKIHEWLQESDWLLLLYTGQGVEWDWCLYETGFLRGPMEQRPSGLYACITMALNCLAL